MNFSERLREIRQKEGLSQEQLAEKIGVSRQAITKWETGKGLPDIENLVIIAEIFKTTLDELILTSKQIKAEAKPELFTSETLYDIDCERHFNINLGSARALTVSSGTDEKLHICLQSDTLEDLDSIFKIKLDGNRNRLDVNCVKKDKISRYEAEEAVSINIMLPEKYAEHCEIAASVKQLEIAGLHIKRLEYDGDAEQILVSESSGSIELTSKTDYEITIDRVRGRLDANQWKAKTIVHIPEAECPAVRNNGRRCEVYYMKDGQVVEWENAERKVIGENRDKEENEDVLSISGICSELIVDLQ
ncbi:MAG: helix-turn-helix domain-containing protein [Lachnospiraceae bacterium]|nr:helix-turn-helix domain-containing protein [Lachnospiraceae bacterium]